MVLPLPQSGTTVSTYGTTMLEPDTTARTCDSTAPESSTTACLSSATLGVLHYAETRQDRGCSKEPKKRGVGAKGTDVYVLIPPKPFQRRPPLNGTAFL